MNTISFILNFPWTITGIILSLFSVTQKFSLSRSPFVIIINIKSFWWYKWLPSKKGVRAMTLGNVVLLGKYILQNDLEHELVHVKQFNRMPLVFPILYYWETLKVGYKNNKYEKETYDATNSNYVGV